MLTVERISTCEEFARIRDEWNAVLRASGSDNINLTHEWLLAWATTFGRGIELCVLRVRDGSETVGFAPLMVNQMRWRRFLRYRQLLLLSHPWSDFGDFLIARDRDAVVGSIFDYLAGRGDWGEILLHDIPATSPNFQALRAVADRRRDLCELAPRSICYFIEMKGRSWEEFYATTNKNFVRKDITRLNGHYATHQWEIREFDGGNLPEAIDAFAGLHRSSQARKGRETFYLDPQFRDFLERLRCEEESSRWIRGYLLEIDRKPAAFVLGFEYARRFHYWNIGFDQEFEKLSPSKYLLYHILRSGFENDRWDEFNFMRGGTDYKRRWTSSSYDIFQLRMLSSRGFYGALNRLRNGRGEQPRAEVVELATD
jgi:CelD/BcsL family acetyltransferase involved in cellulose biosynthesis